MKKIYVLFLLSFLAAKSFSQFAYTVANSTVVSGTYTDLGANGVSIVNNYYGSPISKDDDFSAAQQIGFNFTYNGQVFTQFILHTNGFIKLGIDTPATQTYDMLDSPITNTIYPFGGDLDGGATTEYRVYTSGTAGSRVCTIQYKNVKDWSATTGQYTAVSFQIKLYETTNVIEFVYGPFSASTTASAVVGSFVGIKGSDPASSVNATKLSTAAWTAATFLSGPYTGNRFNNRNSVLPISGTTIRFTPIALPNADAEVASLYTLGKLPLNYSTPHIIRVVVKNKGSNAMNSLVVSLNIAGANPFANSKTINLAVGGIDTVSFDPYTPTNLGASTITVSVPNDDVNTNNSQTFYQTVTQNIFSYADTSRSTGSVGYNTGAGLILNKYKVNGTGQVSGVNVFLAGGIGNQVYAVVLNSAGTIVAKSDSIIIALADSLTYKSFVFTTPPAPFADSIFYVGLAQKANATKGYFPVGYQAELPAIKANQYYTAPIAGGAAPAQNNTIGRFMIEAVMTGAVPLNFLSFTGNLKDKIVFLNWKTANEINTSHFDVERSYDGATFEKIGSVKNVSNPVNVNSYAYNDITLSLSRSKVVYYRLNQIDKDGRSKYSTIVRVSLTGDKSGIIVAAYPNPAKRYINLTLDAVAGNRVSFVITDLSGKVVLKQAALLTQDSQNVRIDVSSLSTGTYLIRGTCAEGCEGSIIKFIKD